MCVVCADLYYVHIYVIYMYGSPAEPAIAAAGPCPPRRLPALTAETNPPHVRAAMQEPTPSCGTTPTQTMDVPPYVTMDVPPRPHAGTHGTDGRDGKKPKQKPRYAPNNNSAVQSRGHAFPSPPLVFRLFASPPPFLFPPFLFSGYVVECMRGDIGHICM